MRRAAVVHRRERLARGIARYSPRYMRKVLYIVSNVTDSTEYELLVRFWDRDRQALEFVLLNREADCSVQRHIRAAGFTCTTYIYEGRKHMARTVIDLVRHLRRSRPDVINCNLLEASVLGLLAGFLTGIGRRTYTRHLAAHNHKYHPVKGVFYDRFCNRLSHKVIAISECTRQVVVEWEGTPADKVVIIHHGYDLATVPKPDVERIQELRRKHAMDAHHGPVIGVISRPFALKGLDQSIPAIGRLMERWPDAHVYLFNWKPTPHSDRYDALLDRLPADRVHRVHFEPDVAHLYHAFDVFIHVPEDVHAEAFGLVYTEAMIAGTPSVFTLSGIMHELDTGRLDGVRTVPFKDEEAIYSAAAAWLEKRPLPSERNAITEANVTYLRELLDIRKRVRAFQDLYASV